MVRSYWKGALVLALAWVSTAKGQQPLASSAPTGQAPEQYVTVQEAGRPPQKCRVLSSEPLPNGGTLKRVQALATGEISTVLEPPANSPGPIMPVPGGNLLTSGTAQSPYATSTVATPRPFVASGGQPIPRTVERDKGKPVSPVSPAVGKPTAPGEAGFGKQGDIRTIQEPGRKPLRCRLLRQWRSGPHSYASQLQSVETGEMLTVVETGPATVMPGTRMKAIPTRIYHWGRYHKSPPGAPVPPNDATVDTFVAAPARMPVQATAPVVPESVTVQPAPPASRGLFARVRSLFSSGTPAQAPVQVVQTQIIEQPMPAQQPLKPAAVPTPKTTVGQTQLSERSMPAQQASKPAAASTPKTTVAQTQVSGQPMPAQQSLKPATSPTPKTTVAQTQLSGQSMPAQQVSKPAAVPTPKTTVVQTQVIQPPMPAQESLKPVAVSTPKTAVAQTQAIQPPMPPQQPIKPVAVSTPKIAPAPPAVAVTPAPTRVVQAIAPMPNPVRSVPEPTQVKPAAAQVVTADPVPPPQMAPLPLPAPVNVPTARPPVQAATSPWPKLNQVVPVRSAETPAPKANAVQTVQTAPVPVITAQPMPQGAARPAPVQAKPAVVASAPTPCSQPGCQDVVCGPVVPCPPARPGVFQKLRNLFGGRTQTCCSPDQIVEVTPAPGPRSAPVVTEITPMPAPVRVTQAPATFMKPAPQCPPDWRQSWGNCSEKVVCNNAPVPGPQSSPRYTGLPRPPASITESNKGRDPLFQPDAVASRAVDSKLSGLRKIGPSTDSRLTTPPAPGQGSAGQDKIPLGAQSVIAAANGLDQNVKYIPVPIVTVPEPKHVPLPPVPQIPQAPQPNNAPYQNAFTPHTLPDAEQGNGQGYPPMMGPGGMMPGYPQMAGHMGMVAPYPGMMPQGRYPMPMYGQAMYPQAPYGMPGYGMPGYGMPGYGMTPGAYPYPPMGMPMQPPGRGTVPYAYQGPLPPNPFAAPVAPAGYRGGYSTGPVAPNWAPGLPRNSAMDRPAVPAGMTAAQASANDQIMEMVTVLKTSVYPSQREWAANNLAACDWRMNPVVVQALLTAAKDDPAATVRSGCVYNLGRMGITAEPVLATLQQLKNDRDPRVRVDAEQALARLTGGQQPGSSTASDRNAVQPVRAVNP